VTVNGNTEQHEATPPSRSVVVIQRNPRSGVAGGRRRLLLLILALKRVGLTPRLFSTRERLDQWMQDATRRATVQVMVAAGGDGTFQDLVNRYPLERITPYPLGTENVFARYLGIGSNPDEFARMVSLAKTRTIDLGSCNGRRFVLMASVGFDAEIIHRAHAGRTGHTSRWQYLKPIGQALWGRRSRPLQIKVDDTPPQLAELAVVVNVPRYALGLNMARKAVDNDGLFEIRLFRGYSAWRMWWYFLHLCLGTHESLPDVVSLRGTWIEVNSAEPQPVQVDGDPSGMTPVQFTILPQAQTIVVP